MTYRPFQMTSSCLETSESDLHWSNTISQMNRTTVIITGKSACTIFIFITVETAVIIFIMMIIAMIKLLKIIGKKSSLENFAKWDHVWERINEYYKKWNLDLAKAFGLNFWLNWKY